ncbi:hypothetical protein BDV28DRAFT_97248 [Aspergillus coremiiformis]|uniref:Uncharacterized protein n=1 Tax=Aspergillus coremiiformis TaxID=138285 RepID=A0A5N6Z9T4_9EURO|nr:hypothetical protein BDV28DRAFT_97248 [Aspergillus coremiiformis]
MRRFATIRNGYSDMSENIDSLHSIAALLMLKGKRNVTRPKDKTPPAIYKIEGCATL